MTCRLGQTRGLSLLPGASHDTQCLSGRLVNRGDFYVVLLVQGLHLVLRFQAAIWCSSPALRGPRRPASPWGGGRTRLSGNREEKVGGSKAV